MKINIVSPQFFPAVSYGGPVFSTLNTAKELAKLGHQIMVSTTNANWDKRLEVDSDKWLEFDTNIFVRYYHDNILNRVSFPLLIGLYKDIKQCDVVFLQYIFSLSTPVALLYASILKKPVLLSPRGSLAQWILDNGKRKSEWLNFLIRPFANRIHWHATSIQEMNEIHRLYPKAKVHIVPNCVPLTNFKHINHLSKAQFLDKFLPGVHIKEPDHIIVSMGRIQPKKGFDILIDAFSIVSKKLSNSILIIAGKDENQLKKLKSQIERLKLSDNVFFCGQINNQDKIDFLANADVFALPSHNENFGNVYAEALAAGLPIVASTNTPWQEAEQFGCGKWVKNSSIDTANAIMEIIDKGKMYYQEQCKTFVQRFSGESIGLNFQKIGQLMIGQSKS
jgi:glycosyltransferase involved in cell wall biosynthesis